jgi:hypothetical protein
MEVCYSEVVHKPIYASGFLYHSASQQILLQQFKNGDLTKLVLFRGQTTNGEKPQEVFQQSVEKELGIKIPASSIHPVYDYTNDKLGEQFIFYIDVGEIMPEAYKSKNTTEWLLLSKIGKYDMSEQTRHDIIVGERVIRATDYETNVSATPALLARPVRPIRWT